MHVNSPRQSTKDILDVGIVTPWFGNGDPQLGIAQCSDGRDDAGDDPDNQRHSHRAGILHHSLWTDKDTRSDNVTCK